MAIVSCNIINSDGSQTGYEVFADSVLESLDNLKALLGDNKIAMQVHINFELTKKELEGLQFDKVEDQPKGV